MLTFADTSARVTQSGPYVHQTAATYISFVHPVHVVVTQSSGVYRLVDGCVADRRSLGVRVSKSGYGEWLCPWGAATCGRNDAVTPVSQSANASLVGVCRGEADVDLSSSKHV